MPKLTNKHIEKIFINSSALLQGHFLLSSGRHSDKYIQCAKILQDPEDTARLMNHIAKSFIKDDIDIVISPAVGGIIVGYELAHQLNVNSLFTERENGIMTLRRGFEIPPNSRVLVAEDVVTTGGSVKEVISVVKSFGATLVGVALLADRSGGSVDFGVKTVAAYTTSVASYEPIDCPICKNSNIALVKPGSKNM